jgi:hypothetical protein
MRTPREDVDRFKRRLQAAEHQHQTWRSLQEQSEDSDEDRAEGRRGGGE